MTVRVEFHFDFASPNTYFCHQVIPDIEARTGVKFDYIPILLGGVFKTTNNKSPMEQFAGIKNKPEYNALETQRFIKQHRIDKFQMNPHFPVNTLHIMRGAIYAKHHGFYKEYIDTIYQCMWEQGLNMADAEVIAQALQDAELPADEIIAGTQLPEIKQELIDNTTASVERGTFGSPTFYVGDEIYFGKDRLRDVEAEITRQASL
ncbi:MAG: 2-hydroxychromene-2-carboxylate isomerase [Gammaproteobacteria bacterium]|jgi:2-hydroxychromene-2-carboxylate isomerase|nr:2-hydroxychromene-2-carboxylate isomerase [Gammaproteobacteria bacterium]MDP6535467.1 2-hydroxychromene-2-carboxylate isomerase [Gammaproteobacteria bacterium]MDP6731880.1 2-hydroxychromene-2-carboxylate isomerase [Gammaproteobacteria bacterium]HAJ75053.1 disulfide bond formation protein DsbA [Gammaproteobacteria bacterium]|tara:strand:+ start:286 stop:900 length:615 start_codon:yes stop_codon:yes gene_type:complete